MILNVPGARAAMKVASTPVRSCFLDTVATATAPSLSVSSGESSLPFRYQRSVLLAGSTPPSDSSRPARQDSRRASPSVNTVRPACFWMSRSSAIARSSTSWSCAVVSSPVS